MTTALSAEPLHIDIVSDVVCPWCIVGYKQLQRALRSLPASPGFEIRWRPFELNPQMPAGGQDIGEHLAEKYGASAEQSRGVRARLTRLGESLGFSFDYFDGMRIYNTFQAHQLLHWAHEQGLQTPLKLALFEAYFSRRENVGDPEKLVEIAARAGLSREAAGEVLESARYAAIVRAEQAQWLEREVHAVPTFFFNDGYPVPGAQEAATFVRVLNRLGWMPASGSEPAR